MATVLLRDAWFGSDVQQSSHLLGHLLGHYGDYQFVVPTLVGYTNLLTSLSIAIQVRMLRVET